MSCAVIEHLQRERLDGNRIHCLRASARHFLVWLGQEDIDIVVIDDAVVRRFRRHDCQCPSMEREGPRCSPARPSSSSERHGSFGSLSRADISSIRGIRRRLAAAQAVPGRVRRARIRARFAHGLSKCLPARPGVAVARHAADGCRRARALRRPLLCLSGTVSRARAGAFGGGWYVYPVERFSSLLSRAKCCRLLYRYPGMRSSMRIRKRSVK